MKFHLETAIVDNFVDNQAIFPQPNFFMWTTFFWHSSLFSRLFHTIAKGWCISLIILWITNEFVHILSSLFRGFCV